MLGRYCQTDGNFLVRLIRRNLRKTYASAKFWILWDTCWPIFNKVWDRRRPSFDFVLVKPSLSATSQTRFGQVRSFRSVPSFLRAFVRPSVSQSLCPCVRGCVRAFVPSPVRARVRSFARSNPETLSHKSINERVVMMRRRPALT